MIICHNTITTSFNYLSTSLQIRRPLPFFANFSPKKARHECLWGRGRHCHLLRQSHRQIHYFLSVPNQHWWMETEFRCWKKGEKERIHLFIFLINKCCSRVIRHATYIFHKVMWGIKYIFHTYSGHLSVPICNIW